jgi:hypothetical protein
MDRKRDDFFIILGVAAIGFFWWLRKRKPSAFDSVTAKELGTLPPNQPSLIQPGGSAQSTTSQSTNNSPLSAQERAAIEEAKKRSGRKRFDVGNILVTTIGNFKYVTVREGTKRGVSLGQPPIYDWVRTTDQPITYAARTTTTIGELSR